MFLERFRLQSLNVMFISTLRPSLIQTLRTLQCTLPHVSFPQEARQSKPGEPEKPPDFLHVFPKRLPRRSWRVFYKSNLRSKNIRCGRGYVFHDWRYRFQFKNIPSGEPTHQLLNAILSSLNDPTSCVVEFNWCNFDLDTKEARNH